MYLERGRETVHHIKVRGTNNSLSHYITSHHITSHYITPHHIISHHTTPHYPPHPTTHLSSFDPERMVGRVSAWLHSECLCQNLQPSLLRSCGLEIRVFENLISQKYLLHHLIHTIKIKIIKKRKKLDMVYMYRQRQRKIYIIM